MDSLQLFLQSVLTQRSSCPFTTASKGYFNRRFGLFRKEPEALVMSRYLKQHFHITKDRMILEDKSTSTELNLKNSKPLLEQAHISVNQPIAIVTSDFHTPRAAAIAKKQGYTQVYMVAAETPLITRYNAWLREYFAYASGWLLNSINLGSESCYCFPAWQL